MSFNRKMKPFECTRRSLFQKLRERGGDNRNRDSQRDHLKEYVLEELTVLNRSLSVTQTATVRAEISTFLSKLYKRWDNCHSMLLRFEERYSDWLDGDEEFGHQYVTSSNKNRGRPEVSFQEAAPRTKRAKSEMLRKGESGSSLAHAAAMQFRAEGKHAAAKLLMRIRESPEEAESILKYVSDNAKSNGNIVRLTGEEAVSAILEADLSKSQYLYMRELCLSHNADVLPSYHKVLNAKKDAYPPDETILVTETSAVIQLQSLLDHDSARLVCALERLDQSVFDDFPSDIPVQLELIHKWGVDGSGCHAQYQQSFEDDSNSDKSVLLTAIVPLQLQQTSSQCMSEKPLWNNPSPCSTKFCKPIRVQFKKETPQAIKEEEQYIRAQYEKLTASKVLTKSGRLLNISHKLKLTMIDGKTRCALTNTASSQTCCICGSTPSQMKLGNPKHTNVDASAFTFGLSVLHARILFLECILHISYKLELKTWRANEELYKLRKQKVQDGLKKNLHILVDVVKQGGGTTNDGNTARRFFENPVDAAAITGVSEELIRRFATVQCALACSLPLDTQKLCDYCLDTAKLFEDTYPWYHMPASVHLILLHGADIVSSLDLPMGIFSEEALEALNKYIRAFREHRTRKFSRLATMHDLFYRLLLAGDVLFAVLRHSTTGALKNSLPDAVQTLLL